MCVRVGICWARKNVQRPDPNELSSVGIRGESFVGLSSGAAGITDRCVFDTARITHGTQSWGGWCSNDDAKQIVVKHRHPRHCD